MNFEQLKLQMHMRSLYERLGAMDAELLIVEAFEKEMARHERLEEIAAAARKRNGAELPSV
jgi:hypothetical protein